MVTSTKIAMAAATSNATEDVVIPAGAVAMTTAITHAGALIPLSAIAFARRMVVKLCIVYHDK